MTFALTKFAGIALAGAALAGCAAIEEAQLSTEQNIGLCPNAFVLSDAARMVDFVGEPAIDTVAWSAEITDVRTSCRYVGDRPIEASVEIDFAVGRGPAADTQEKAVPYFVAVTRRNLDLIAKEEFSAPVKINRELGIATVTQSIDQIVIPRADEGTSGANFEIAVGFSLTRDQVLYNRSGSSLKFPEL